MKRAAEQVRRDTAPHTRTRTERRRRASPSRRALCVLLSMLTLTGCQAPGRGRSDIRTMHVDRVEGYVEFVARQREHSQASKVGAGKTSSEETILEENLKLKTSGYVYHPNFLEFTVAALFGLLQRDYEDVFGDRRRTSGDDGTVVEFDVRGSFFKKKDYPGTVFARRYRAFEPRPFQPTLEATTTNYGLTWQYVDEKMPTSLQFSSTEVELDPGNDLEAIGRQKNSLLRFQTEYRFTDNNVLSFVYTRESTDEQPFALSYDTDELTLGHTWRFGPHHRHSLESEINYQNQRGTFDVERTRWRELLRLEHSDTLRSWYRWEALDRKQGSLSGVAPLSERSYSLEATVEHKLYESLVSRLRGYGQSQEFGSGLDIQRYGFEANFDYRKKHRGGMLLADYRLGYRIEEYRGGGREMEVLDEPHTFHDPEPEVLSNTRVSTGSIRVTAEDRTTLYRLNDDYRVQMVGDQTEIRRVPTGRIIDGQTVLIDYVFSVGGSFDLDTVVHHLSLRDNLDFGLSPYYRLFHQKQDVTPADAVGVTPEDITAHVVGMEFERGPLRLTAEYEDHDSTINPFRATRLSASYNRRFSTGARAMLRAKFSDVDRGKPNARETTFYTFEGYYRHPITRHLNVETTVLYRNEDDSLTGVDEGVELDFALEWDIRQTEVRIQYEYGKYRDAFADNDASSLYVRVRRKF
ncbi:MAG: hypothetical protein ACE5HE_10500 [Phycisphaerae bacterium]